MKDHLFHKSKEEINSELGLIKAAKLNVDAFGPLYDKYYKPIFLFIFRRTEDEDLTADLTQHVFIAAMINIKRYEFKGVPLSAWLYRIALNEISMYFRKTKKERTISIEQNDIKNIFEEVEENENEEKINKLTAVLSKLKSDEMQLVELRFFEQRAFAEIGVMLGISENNAKVKMYRLLEKLKKLLSLCPYIDSVTTDRTIINPDYAIPMLSLPYLFDTELETILSEIPYLYADANLITYWKEKLKTDTNFKVGLCWNGSGTEKDVPVELFAHFSKIPGISLYSLQKNGSKDLNKLQNNPIIDFGPELDEEHGGFMDTAAIMKSLDLVITIDTSIAHLAGGLGTPVWTLLPYSADWRWFRDRDDSPWYPTMRLFRQAKQDEWGSVIQDIVKALSAIIQK